MKKKFLIFTGPSTSGKTTYIRLLNSKYANPKIQSIPQTTTRKRRDDDDHLIKHTSKYKFENEFFFVSNSRYGILYNDVDNYIKSKKHNIAVLICGPEEILKLPPNYDISVVMIRFSKSIDDEILIIKNRMKKYFSHSEYDNRLKSNVDLTYRYFHNSFFEKKVSLIIMNKSNVEKNISNIEDKLNIKLFKKKSLISSEFNKVIINSKRDFKV